MRIEDAGVIWTQPKKCRPLDSVSIEFRWNGLRGQAVHFKITDADHHEYAEMKLESHDGQARTSVVVAGRPGVHHILAITTSPDGKEYRRHGCFRVEASTSLHGDQDEFNDLFQQLEEGLRQTIDVSVIDGRKVTHHKHADNTEQNLAYPAYAFATLRYFVSDMKSAFDVQFDYQYPDGSLPDHIYSDNYPCPLTTRRLRSCMADLETGAAVTLFKTWQAHGDNTWVATILPKMEAALEYVLSDPKTFDVKHGVIKRPHTLDEWDIHFSPAGQGSFLDEKCVYVIMQGDTSSMFDACQSLAAIYESLRNEERAARWRMMRDHFRKIGNQLFWDGVKYRHHIHLDEFDHKDFNEDEQLTMSNTFAIDRGFADHAQAVSIVKEYLRRWKETGDRFPWWSLQPGYPDYLGYFKGCDPWKRAQGNYANGGLFPWVGGKLCAAAFQHGMESVGLTLLRDFHGVLKRDNGAVFTWYDLKGNAAISAPHNQTNYDAWGLFAWTEVLIEDLGGIESDGRCFEHVRCSPKWSITGAKEITLCAHFPASDSYFTYSYHSTPEGISIRFAGTGRRVEFRVLLPSEKSCRAVTIDGRAAAFTEERVENSLYVVIPDMEIRGARELVCAV